LFITLRASEAHSTAKTTEKNFGKAMIFLRISCEISESTAMKKRSNSKEFSTTNHTNGTNVRRLKVWFRFFHDRHIHVFVLFTKNRTASIKGPRTSLKQKGVIS